MAEGARLESVYALIPYRGFESLSHRQIAVRLAVRCSPIQTIKPSCSNASGFFVVRYCTTLTTASPYILDSGSGFGRM